MQWKTTAAWRAAIHLAPVTTLIVVVAMVLQLAMTVDRAVHPDHSREVLRHWGAVTQLGLYRQTRPDGTMEAVPQMTGPFDLWEGQVWRIPVSGFHHGGPLHLLLNCLALWYLGQLLEPRMGRVRYLLFFLTATVLSLLPEYLAGNTPVGLSGAVYAVFGVLLVLRRQDREVAEALSESLVRFCILWMFAAVILTLLDLLRIANLAHFTGFGYGWIAGEVLFGRWASRRGAVGLFLVGHLLLLPVFHAVVHPKWNGRYHWYLAHEATDPKQRLAHLENAVQRDPSLRGPWVEMARIQYRQKHLSVAWKTILTGLDYNRSDQDSLQIARAIWQAMRTKSERQKALDLLEQVFGAAAADWQQYLGIGLEDPFAADSFAADPRHPVRPIPFPADRFDPADPVGGVGGQPLPFSAGHPSSPLKKNLSAPPVDPNDPSSAAEGTGI